MSVVNQNFGNMVELNLELFLLTCAGILTKVKVKSNVSFRTEFIFVILNVKDHGFGI